MFLREKKYTSPPVFNMKYKCKDCGKIYSSFVDYCSCGNDSFTKILTKEEAANGIDDIRKPDKKENYFALILFFIIIAVGAFFLFQRLLEYQKSRNLDNSKYVGTVIHSVFKEFSPQGIEKSGHCKVSFTVDENGEIQNEKIEASSQIHELDSKLYKLMKNAARVEIPPAAYVNKPITVDFQCIATQYEVECNSKNIVNQ